MEKHVKESYGLMRVREVLKGPGEIKGFEKAYDCIISAYNTSYSMLDSKTFLDLDFITKNDELKEFFSPANVICNLANLYNIYLDRPNDPISCFVFGIARSSVIAQRTGY